MPLNGLRTKHQGTVFVSDAVGDHEPAAVATGRCIQVAILESLQLVSVAASKPTGGGLHVDVGKMPRAECKTGDGEKQGGTDDVADLKAGVIVAVPERWQFDDPRIPLHCRAKLLREDGMGNVDVLEFVPAVRNAHTDIVCLGQMVIEVGADALD